MSTVEEFERDCAYCRQPIRLKWKDGLVPPEGVRLVADQVFHDKCWDQYWANFDGRRALPRGVAEAAQKCAPSVEKPPMES